ncbi:MAG: hypothetical protein WC529_08890 [Candidatus Margulisiibacteriota bacterium]
MKKQILLLLFLLMLVFVGLPLRPCPARAAGIMHTSGSVMLTTDSDKLGGQLPAYYQTAFGFNAHTGEAIAHGTTGAIVGTSDAQVLTGKTINASQLVAESITGAKLAADLGISTTGNITAAAFTTAGTVEAGWLKGDGTQITGLTSGTITQINAGSGLTGGPITSTGTISIDAASSQTFANLTATSTMTATMFSSNGLLLAPQVACPWADATPEGSCWIPTGTITPEIYLGAGWLHIQTY